MRQQHQQHEPISNDECYTLDEFMKRTGLKRYSLATAKRNGLRVIYTSKRAFVRGADWDDYLNAIGQDDDRIGFRTP